MLNKVKFKLTYAQISEFILEKEYTNFVAFDIMINNHKMKNSAKKILEEEIIKTIYLNN